MQRLYLLATFAVLAAGCPRNVPGSTPAREGSCEDVCSRYLYCKGSGDPMLKQECDSDCRFIYHERGRPDKSSLSHLQSLDCDKLLSFIEGESGRALGEEPTISSEPAPESVRAQP